MRRAAFSIPVNVAEGFGRWHAKEFVHFLLVAHGSSNSLRSIFSSESALAFSALQS
jgi:four helix bundle protein